MSLPRRRFLQAAAGGLLLAGLGLPGVGRAAGGRVVVVGGGTGGATAAKYLRRLDPSLQVTLIERNPTYTTCYLSNEVLGGGRAGLGSLQFGYDGMRGHGVQVVHDEVTAIDPVTRSVQTAGGTAYPYDRCIVSPGIDFRTDTVAGLTPEVAEAIPHAWRAGPQTLLLRDRLRAMENGGVVVIGVPPNPYRCPPAPYERASQIARYLKLAKPRSKVILLDPKTSFTKQALFEQAWRERYGYGTADAMIEWVSGDHAAGVVGVESTGNGAGTLITEFGDRVRGAVLNLIPAQKAGPIAFAADLVDATGWCPVELLSFESTRHAGVHVIGDACQADALPKSGFAANSEAKACAAAVVALLNGVELPNPTFGNGCYSLVADDWAISVVGVYRLADDGKSIQGIPGAGGTSSLAATEEERRLDVQYAYGWYNNFTRDVFF